MARKKIKKAAKKAGRPEERVKFDGTFDEALDRVLKAGAPAERKPYKRKPAKKD